MDNNKKIKIQKGIISRIKECHNYYRLYYNTKTCYCWCAEFESCNNWIEFASPDVIEFYHNNGCKSIFKTAPLTKKDILNLIKIKI